MPLPRLADAMPISPHFIASPSSIRGSTPSPNALICPLGWTLFPSLFQATSSPARVWLLPIHSSWRTIAPVTHTSLRGLVRERGPRTSFPASLLPASIFAVRRCGILRREREAILLLRDKKDGEL